jgi:anthranilate synthase component 2
VGENRLFAGMPEQFQVARYHSLSAKEATLPEELRVTARSEDGEVMAVEHKEKPIFGLQFHPESVLTPMGDQIMKNFMEVIKTTK